MQTELLQSDIEELIESHGGAPLDQDVGPLFGVLAMLAREIAYRDTSIRAYEQAARAALCDQSSDDPQIVAWRRIIRRVSRRSASGSDSLSREKDAARNQFHTAP